MLFSPRWRWPSPAMVVAVTALVSSFAGPAIAEQAAELAKRSKLMPGSKIKPRSLAGNRLKANAATGKEVNEAKLGKVPSAVRADSATNATNATNATRAITATTAINATFATNATNASSATNATNATNADKLDGFDASDLGQTLWAVVEATNSGATVVRGHGAIGAGWIANGLYFVAFDRDVTQCAYLATVGSTTNGASPMYSAGVEQRPSNPTDIRVRTFDAGGLQSPGTGNGFHVGVFCP
jgi:hypothetical protein